MPIMDKYVEYLVHVTMTKETKKKIIKYIGKNKSNKKERKSEQKSWE